MPTREELNQRLEQAQKDKASIEANIQHLQAGLKKMEMPQPGDIFRGQGCDSGREWLVLKNNQYVCIKYNGGKLSGVLWSLGEQTFKDCVKIN
jgi:hypothetical protein